MRAILVCNPAAASYMIFLCFYCYLNIFFCVIFWNKINCITFKSLFDVFTSFRIKYRIHILFIRPCVIWLPALPLPLLTTLYDVTSSPITLVSNISLDNFCFRECCFPLPLVKFLLICYGLRPFLTILYKISLFPIALFLFYLFFFIEFKYMYLLLFVDKFYVIEGR